MTLRYRDSFGSYDALMFGSNVLACEHFSRGSLSFTSVSCKFRLLNSSSSVPKKISNSLDE